jgi:hypothetical protein
MRGMRSLELGRVLLGLGACVFGAGALGACTTGEGTGEVRSEHLFLRDCHNGPFDLQPDFFATNPFKDTQTIRVQRGDRMEELSDGLSILVTDVAAIRGDDGGEGRLGQDVRIGLPVGVAPPGQVVEYDPDPPPVSMTLYLNDSCHVQNSAIYAIDGTIRFTSLFNGNTRESRAENRLTEAEFTATFADPRELSPGDDHDPALLSVVTGHFRFFFQRGQPAQPFP